MEIRNNERSNTYETATHRVHTTTQTECADALGYITPSSITTRVLAGELINSNIIQRLLRVEIYQIISVEPYRYLAITNAFIAGTHDRRSF